MAASRSRPASAASRLGGGTAVEEQEAVLNLFGADAAAVAWRMRSAVALLRDGLLVKRPYVRVVEHLPLAAAAHAAHAAHAAAAHAAHAAVAHAARAAARARAAAVALLRVRKVVAEIGGARVDDDAHQLEELGRASGLAGSPSRRARAWCMARGRAPSGRRTPS